MTTRAEWQQLAADRILDAQAHLAAGVDRWSAAYYLIGYAVECGLKSCVLARVAAHPEVIYQDRGFSNAAWTHDVESLLVVADLRPSATLMPRRTLHSTSIGSESSSGMRRQGISRRPKWKHNTFSMP